MMLCPCCWTNANPTGFGTRRMRSQFWLESLVDTRRFSVRIGRESWPRWSKCCNWRIQRKCTSAFWASLTSGLASDKVATAVHHCQLVPSVTIEQLIAAPLRFFASPFNSCVHVGFNFFSLFLFLDCDGGIVVGFLLGLGRLISC